MRCTVPPGSAAQAGCLRNGKLPPTIVCSGPVRTWNSANIRQKRRLTEAAPFRFICSVWAGRNPFREFLSHCRKHARASGPARQNLRPAAVPNSAPHHLRLSLLCPKNRFAHRPLPLRGPHPAGFFPAICTQRPGRSSFSTASGSICATGPLCPSPVPFPTRTRGSSRISRTTPSPHSF